MRDRSNYRTCSRCAAVLLLSRVHFRASSKTKSGFTSVCRTCSKERPYRKQVTRQAFERGAQPELVRCKKHEDSCHDLPHRRPLSGCPHCGGAYAPDVITVESTHELPYESRRVWP